jgi:hypothetical protein
MPFKPHSLVVSPRREVVHFLHARMTGNVSKAVDSYYEQSAAPVAETEGECLAIGRDGKGVRLVKSERTAAPAADAPKARLGKGEKPGTKKEALVTVDFSFQPAARSSEEIIKARLHQFTAEERAQATVERQQRREQGEPEPRVALNKHVRAFFRRPNRSDGLFDWPPQKARSTWPQIHYRVGGWRDRLGQGDYQGFQRT